MNQTRSNYNLSSRASRKHLTDKHGWVVTGINPLTELREVISIEMLWDVAVSKAATNKTHLDVQIMRYNPQIINKQGIIMQQSLPFADIHRLEISEEGVIYCDGLTCAAWMNTDSRCDSCPVPPQKQK